MRYQVAIGAHALGGCVPCTPQACGGRDKDGWIPMSDEVDSGAGALGRMDRLGCARFSGSGTTQRRAEAAQIRSARPRHESSFWARLRHQLPADLQQVVSLGFDTLGCSSFFSPDDIPRVMFEVRITLAEKLKEEFRMTPQV